LCWQFKVIARVHPRRMGAQATTTGESHDHAPLKQIRKPHVENDNIVNGSGS
jgi:hypothetical protein